MDFIRKASRSPAILQDGRYKQTRSKTLLAHQLRADSIACMKMTEHDNSVTYRSSKNNYRRVQLAFSEQSSWTVHPATSLLVAHNDELRENRTRLVQEIRQISKPLACVVLKVLKKRDELTPPAIGEVWPWLLADLAHVAPEKVRGVAKAWLAIYIYTLLLDRTCDEPDISPDPVDTLAGALLFEIGIGDFYTMAAGSAWQKIIRNAVRSAIRYQEVDVRLSGQITRIDSKRRSAAGKNNGFVICSAALAAVSNLDGSTFNRFTKSVLLAFQHLDDIADFESDWKNKNFTPLLVQAHGQLKQIENCDADRFDILTALLKSGALRDILAEAQSIIALALDDMIINSGISKQSNASKFFDELQAAISITIEIIDSNTLLLTKPGHDAIKQAALEKIERQLNIVAQQS